ncbi:divalent-cation tolerance protein CutA [Amycolatopsis sp. NPDC059657]|uniref:divalent-cation tolerance protein CutA n=1 Tax=Amycolatopsis sp. NPDC059657 TaxID=3346899 RepID=UPI0036712FA4
MDVEHVVVTTTVSSEPAARALATGAIEARLGACAQIVGPLTSVYRWEGAVRTETEWRVEIKAAARRAPELTEFLKVEHAYDLPEVIVVPIVGGSAEYLSWLAEETR